MKTSILGVEHDESENISAHAQDRDRLPKRLNEKAPRGPQPCLIRRFHLGRRCAYRSGPVIEGDNMNQDLEL